jgi:5-formyltetrahydrofolate cyclo-ligase
MTVLPPTKAALRRRALDNRDLIDAAQAHAAADAMATLAQQLVRKLAAPPAIVAGYWPIRSEISTRPLLERLAADGFRTALPVMTGAGKPLLFRSWTPGDALDKGALGLSEPEHDASEVLPDVMFTPLAAFDSRGGRIGYGGGNFDATLAALRAGRKVIAIGLAYSGQEIERVPQERHDQKLDFAVTEERVFSF